MHLGEIHSMMIGDDLSLIKEIAVFFHRKILNIFDKQRDSFNPFIPSGILKKVIQEWDANKTS